MCESVGTKVRVRRVDSLVEADDLLVELCADAANEPIAERRHFAQYNGRSWLVRPSAWGEWSECNIAHGHGRRSASAIGKPAMPKVCAYETCPNKSNVSKWADSKIAANQQMGGFPPVKLPSSINHLTTVSF
jgi:hypothetical protein